MASILTDVKKMLGITADYTHFDQDIIIHINSVFNILKQLGVGPSEGFIIEDKFSEWDEYLKDVPDSEMVKSYMYLKVKSQFDPPSGGAHAEALRNQIAEYEWRLNVDKETVW